MHCVGEFAVALLGPVLILPLVQLVSVQVEPVLVEFVVLLLPQVDMFGPQYFLLLALRVEFNLLAFKLGGPPLAEEQLVLAAVVHHEFVLSQLQAIFVVFDDETRQHFVVNDVWYLFVVEL